MRSYISAQSVAEARFNMQCIQTMRGAYKQVETVCDSEMLSRDVAVLVSAIVVCIFHCLSNDVKADRYNVIGCGIVDADTFVAMLPIVIQARKEVVSRDDIDPFFDQARIQLGARYG